MAAQAVSAALATVPFTLPLLGTVATQRSETWEEMADSVLDGAVRESVSNLRLLNRQAQAELRDRLRPALREVRRRFDSGQTVAGFNGWEDYLRSIGLNPNTWRSWEFRASVDNEFSEQQSSEARPLSSDEWYTPQHILSRVVDVMGGHIDLDPCSNQGKNVPAARHFVKDDDGLRQSWEGRVFMNPPFGPQSRNVPKWTEKLLGEFGAGNVSEAVALVPANRECFRTFADYTVCVLFERLRFLRPAGEPTQSGKFDSAVVYLGPNLSRFYHVFRDAGNIWRMWQPVS